MNRKQAIKEFNKIKKVIGKNIEDVYSLIDNSKKLSNIVSQLKITKGNKKTIKELTEINNNIVDSIKELATNIVKVSKVYDSLGILLFNYPHFP